MRKWRKLSQKAYCAIPWTDVYVSPMKRTIATAQPLCDVMGLPMQIRDGLREIGYGAWENKEQEDIRLHYEPDYIRWLTEPPGILRPTAKRPFR